MIQVLRHPAFRRLFSAQVVALVGTGLATVALALLAYDLAGDDAGAVLGTALAIKMGVYVLLAPLAGALVPPAQRKRTLVVLDVVRAGVVLVLPLVTEVWQVYLLIALLQSASASFTPLFQSIIPEVLPDERDYTAALSLSRLAYDLESLLSPALAAALLAWISFSGLFVSTSLGFLLSAAFVLWTVLPAGQAPATDGKMFARASRGVRIHLRTPRLRGLLALNLCAAAGGAMVFVNTVVVVRDGLGGGNQQVAWALSAFGAGSMLVAMLLPRVLARAGERRAMLLSGGSMVLVLAATATLWSLAPALVGWPVVLAAWLLLGAGYAGVVTPGGLLLRRSAAPADLAALFAAQFSLSHACWLVAYPLAGWVGAAFGQGIALWSLALLCACGFVAATIAWPALDPGEVPHRHDGLPAGHPHWGGADPPDGVHVHPFVIDDLHRRWPG